MTAVAKHDGEAQKKTKEIVKVTHPAALFPRWMERFEEVFADMWPPVSSLFREELAMRVPRLDVYEEGGSIVVKAELPGMKREEIDVRVSGNALTISGKKEREEKIERKDYRRIERATGEFARTITLPAEVDVEKLTASCKDGLLEIRAPKVEGAEPRGRKIVVS